MRVDIPAGLQLLVGTSLYVAVEEDCTSGLVTEVFDDSGKVGADVLLLHCCPHDAVAYLVSRLSREMTQTRQLRVLLRKRENLLFPQKA